MCANHETSKVLVTGAGGFIGTHLCKDLVRAGIQVRAATRGSLETFNPGNSLEYVKSPGLGTASDWSAALGGITHVVHLAVGSYSEGSSKPGARERYRLLNVGGSMKLARDAAAAGVRRFVFISSVKAMAERTSSRDDVLRETAEARPTGFYGICKLEAESAIREAAQRTDMEVVSLRPPLVYGPGVKGNFQQLLMLVDRNKPLPLGLAVNRRSLVYVKNLTHAIRTCLFHRGAAGQAYLVADRVILSIRELLLRLGTALGKPAKLVPIPAFFVRLLAAVSGKGAQAGKLLDPLIVSTEKIRSELNWEEPFSVDDGLRHTAEWYVNRGWE